MSECKVFDSDCELAKFLAAQLLLLAGNAIEKKQKFIVGLSGGSLAKIFCENFLSVHNDNPLFWKSWYFVFCDERYVPHDDPESTYGFYKKNFFDKMPIPSENVLKLNHSLSVEDAASAYEAGLRKLVEGSHGFPCLDVLLLGTGPDGHTCSLFPDHHLLTEKSKWVAHLVDSPKPPPSRITLTLPLLNHAHHAFVVACGSSKAPIIKDALENEESSLPIAQVKSANVVWLVDAAAASLLPPHLTTRSEL